MCNLVEIHCLGSQKSGIKCLGIRTALPPRWQYNLEIKQSDFVPRNYGLPPVSEETSNTVDRHHSTTKQPLTFVVLW